MQHNLGQLRSAEFFLLLRLDGVLNRIGHVEEVAPSRWHWTFGPDGFDVHGSDCSSRAAAAVELAVVRQELYPEWKVVAGRRSHLLWVKQQIADWRLYQHFIPSATLSRLLAASPNCASKLVRPGSDDTRASAVNAMPGFWNPGWNCCYLNSVLQCLFTCRCVRTFIETAGGALGPSSSGDGVEVISVDNDTHN